MGNSCLYEILLNRNFDIVFKDLHKVALFRYVNRQKRNDSSLSVEREEFSKFARTLILVLQTTKAGLQSPSTIHRRFTAGGKMASMGEMHGGLLTMASPPSRFLRAVLLGRRANR